MCPLPSDFRYYGYFFPEKWDSVCRSYRHVAHSHYIINQMLWCKPHAATQAIHLKFAYIPLHVLFILVPLRLYFAFLICQEYIVLKGR